MALTVGAICRAPRHGPMSITGAAHGRLIVSGIYDWYVADFGGGVEGVLDHLRCYAEADLKARLRGIIGIAGDVYGWALNEAR